MVKLAIDKSDSRWIKKSQKGPCFKMERHPAYYEKHNKTTGGPDMKMLKKLAALVLAATMVLVLFTACGGDGGSTGTREPEKEKAAFESIAKDNRMAATAKVNDPQLQAVAEKHLNEDLQAQIDFFGAKFFGKVHVDGKEEEYLTITVTTRYDYGSFLTKILKAVESEINREVGTNVKVDGNGSWTKLGVVVKSDNSHSYMAVAFQIKNPKK